MELQKYKKAILLIMISITLISWMTVLYANSDLKEKQEIQALSTRYTELNILISLESREIENTKQKLNDLIERKNNHLKDANNLTIEINNRINNLTK